MATKKQNLEDQEEMTLVDEIYEFGVGKALLIFYALILIDWVLAMLVLNYYLEWRLQH